MEKDLKKRKFGTRYTMIPRSVMIVFCYIMPALLVAALIVVGVWGGRNRAKAETLERTNKSIYSQAYTELADSVYNMHIALSKLMVSEAPSTLSETLDSIWRESGTVAGLMGRIPQSHVDSYELNRFLIRIGDYAHSLSSALRRGGRLTEDDRGQLMEVYTASEDVFNELSEKLHSGNIPNSALDGNGYFSKTETKNETQDGENAGDLAQDQADLRYPSLIYDGPFSESTEKQQAQGLTGDDMEQNAALKKAREYLEDEGASLEYDGISYGKIPFHGFSGQLSDGKHAEIAVSVKGGHLLYMRLDQDRKEAANNQPTNGGEEKKDANSNGENAQTVDEKELTRLKQEGLAWLSKMGYDDMEATYAQYYPDSVLISYAATMDGKFQTADEGLDALCMNSDYMSEIINELRNANELGEPINGRVVLYSDLVKLWIDRQSGRIVCVDAENYLFSHTERKLQQEIISSEDAAQRLSKNLEIEKIALALIPMPDRTERLCHEFTGSFADAKYIVYLDARTGDEVQIFRIINDENGTGVL